ncbi:MAG: guanylate kinase [Holosporales bacterium]|jgi:guanylate kinase|nr:guanylate kinase [Holosporales bacterium]
MQEPYLANLTRKGMVFAVSAPSGCGKTTIVDTIVKEIPKIVRLITVNTREKRSSEIDGKDYIFVSEKQFTEWIEKDLFLEYVEIYETKRGILKSILFQNIEQGIDTICNVEGNGARRLKEALGENLASIFILPPSLEELQNRIEKRAQDSPKEIKKRLDNAVAEMSFSQEYDYCVINNDLKDCIKTIKSIIKAERQKTFRAIKSGVVRKI